MVLLDILAISEAKALISASRKLMVSEDKIGAIKNSITNEYMQNLERTL